eukprot:TRINITY_DN5086_c0_g1_i1.p1 TRINITY_DN5086_c0_g1~~TRINITY_DN5086_c0_g1_i1.p1  ORF type:complete len:145 (-),score=13.89 TRINITY_DN5086_c0_g1_i1:51-485(-)
MKICSLVSFLLSVVVIVLSTLAGPTEAFLNGMSMKLHGHYCGVNYGDATYAQDPIDAVDMACRNHDKCYDDQQYSDCLCDSKFIEELAAIDGKTISPQVKNIATLMSSWFKSSPCVCFDGKSVRQISSEASLKERSKCLRIKAH